MTNVEKSFGWNHNKRLRQLSVFNFLSVLLHTEKPEWFKAWKNWTFRIAWLVCTSWYSRKISHFWRWLTWCLRTPVLKIQKIPFFSIDWTFNVWQIYQPSRILCLNATNEWRKQSLYRQWCCKFHGINIQKIFCE